MYSSSYSNHSLQNAGKNVLRNYDALPLPGQHQAHHMQKQNIKYQEQMMRDYSNLQLFNQMSQGRKTGLEGAESLLSYQPIQPYNQQQNNHFYQSHNVMQQPMHQNMQQSMIEPRVAKQIQRQNEMIQQLAKSLKFSRNPQKLDLIEENKNFLPFYQKQKQEEPPSQPSQPIQPHYNTPPPVMMPPHLQSYKQKQEREEYMAEKLRLLKLLKRVRDENIQLRVLAAQQSQNRIAVDEEEDDDEQTQALQNKQMAQREPTPIKVDMKLEYEKLDKLKRKRGQVNLKKFFDLFALCIKFINACKNEVKMKRDDYINNFAVNMQTMLVELTEYYKQLTQDVVKTFTNPKQKPIIQCNLFSLQGKLSKSDIKNRREALQVSIDDIIIFDQKYVKMFIDRVVDNIQDLPPFTLYYLGVVLNNRLATPPYFLLKYEINRLNYTHLGGFDKMDDRKKQMMVIMIILVRVYLTYLMKIWEPFPDDAKPKKDQIKHNTQLQENILNICSGIYEIIVEYLRGLVPVQHNNQQHLPQEYLITQRPKGFIQIPDYRELDENKEDLNAFQLGETDELILYPMIPKDLLEAFHLDTQFKNQMMALIEGWATQIVENVNYVAEEEKRELIKDYMNGERNEILKNLEDKDKDLDEYLKDKKELYDNLQEEVNYQQEKVKEYEEQGFKLENSKISKHSKGSKSCKQSKTSNSKSRKK